MFSLSLEECLDFSRSVILTEIVEFLWENLDSTSSVTPSSDTYPY